MHADWKVWVLRGALLAALVVSAFSQDRPGSVILSKPGEDVKLEHAVDSTKVQVAYEKEKSLQLQFQLAQLQLQLDLSQLQLQHLQQQRLQQQQGALQDQYQVLEKGIADWIEKVKKENHLGDDVSYDREHDKWVRIPKPAPAAKK